MSVAPELSRRASALVERTVSERPTSWRPDQPELEHPNPLVGLLARVDTGHTSFGARTIAVVRDPAGREWGVWLLHKVLADEFAEQAPKIGELLAIRYLGRVQPDGDRPAYVRYRVVVDRDGPSVGERTAEPPVQPSERPAEGSATRDEGSGMPGDRAPEAVCKQCGYPEPEHAPGCLPF
jgi:hypothetical protein